MDATEWTVVLTQVNVKPKHVQTWAPLFAVALDDSKFDKGQSELIEFLAQVIHESGHLSTLTENMNYTPQGLLSTFGTHRITAAQAATVGRIEGRPADQRAIANIVYGGEWGRKKLGNTMPDDGWLMRGSGLIQTTGRDNFAYLKRVTPHDVLAKPELLRTPGVPAVECGIAQWKRLVKPHYIGDAVAIRKAINGGTLGMAECEQLRAKLQVACYRA